MTSIPPISGIPAITTRVTEGATEVTRSAGGQSFGSTVKDALVAVSDAERQADAVAVDIASGGSSSVHELMVATSKASLSVDLLVQMRNRAVEAYQEIMRMQI